MDIYLDGKKDVDTAVQDKLLAKMKVIVISYIVIMLYEGYYVENICCNIKYDLILVEDDGYYYHIV